MVRLPLVKLPVEMVVAPRTINPTTAATTARPGRPRERSKPARIAVTAVTTPRAAGWFLRNALAKENAMASTESEVRALLDSRVEACRTKDIDRLMSLYSPSIVYFDVVPPLRFVGSDAVRGNFVRWFNEYEGPIGLETHELTVATSGNVAFANMLHLDRGNANLSERKKFWLRSTVCCQRSDDNWLITHEHISLPVDFRSGTVLMDLVP